MTPRKRIAYVQAAWHTDITDRCKQAFTAELAKQSYDESGVDFFSAPGSLEIPLKARQDREVRGRLRERLRRRWWDLSA